APAGAVGGVDLLRAGARRLRPLALEPARVLPRPLAGSDGGPRRRFRAELPAARAARHASAERHAHPPRLLRGRGGPGGGGRQGLPRGRGPDGAAAARLAGHGAAPGRSRPRGGPGPLAPSWPIPPLPPPPTVPASEASPCPASSAASPTGTSGGSG